MNHRKTPLEILRTFSNPSQLETIEWLADASIKELHEILKFTNQLDAWHIQARIALDVKLAEHASKPHWTLSPTFFVSVVVLIVSILAWLFPREPSKTSPQSATSSNSSPAISPYIPKPQTNAIAPPQVSPPATQMLQPAIGMTNKTNH